MESAKTWQDRLSEGWPASQSTKRNVLIKYTEAGRRNVLEVCRTHDDKYKWKWNQVTDDISLLGRAIGRNRVEVVKYFMETPGINKSKCGIRKYGKCHMNPIMQCLQMAETRDTRAMLIAILRAATYVGPACDVNLRRRNGVSGLGQAIMLKHPEYTRILLCRNDLYVNTNMLGDTPLSLSIRLDRATHAQYLVGDRRVKVNSTEPEPPIITSASCLMSSNMKIILGAGGDPNKTYLDPWVHREIDAYHINIRQCLYVRLPSHLEEKARMALALLDGGYVRKINHKQIEAIMAESALVSAPPLQAQMNMIRALMELPNNRVCPLQYLARACIVKRLRTKGTNNIIQCIRTLTKTQNLTIACQNCLLFK